MKKVFILFIIYTFNLRKIYLYTGLLFILFFNINKTFSDNDFFNETKLYSTISDNLKNLSNDIYTADLIGDDLSIKEKINELSGTYCIKNDLNEAEFRKIANGEISYLNSKINKNCKGKDGSIGRKNQEKLINAINYLDAKLKKDSVSKSVKLIKISKSGIYADGIENNSPFDLIKDIEEIDEIIFEKTKEYEYEGDTNINLWQKIKNKINEKKQEKEKNNTVKDSLNNINNPDVLLCKLEKNCEKKSDLNDFLCKKLGNCEENRGKNYNLIKNNNICKTNKSGLKNITEKIIELDIDKKTKKDKISVENNKIKTNNNNDKNNIILNSKRENLNIPKSDYKKPNDSSLFPCNDTFCIEVDYNTYTHNLLGGWTRTYPSIEYILKRSNSHLKPFINSNLDQAKMTNENFELSIINLNLSDALHMAIHLEFKPVPILELEDRKHSKSAYSSENILREYYKSYGLDYDMKNDLTNYNVLAENRQSILNSTYLNPNAAGLKFNDYKTNIKLLSQKTNFIEKTIEQEIKTDIIGDLEKDFREIEIFAKAINYYTIRLDAVLDNMLKIPQIKGKT